MILDRLESSRPANVYILHPHCKHPHLAPSTSYVRGCRCTRCIDAAATYRQEHTMTDIDDTDLDAGNEPCADCNGTGLDPFDNPCEWCGGTGTVDT